MISERTSIVEAESPRKNVLIPKAASAPLVSFAKLNLTASESDLISNRPSLVILALIPLTASMVAASCSAVVSLGSPC